MFPARTRDGLQRDEEAVNPGIVSALLAAALFGASTPLAKSLMGHVEPAMLAGLLYLGSGAGLLSWLGVRSTLWPGQKSTGVTGADIPWLIGAILSGGIAGPLLLMAGLAITPAATASLLLNVESVLTAGLAWFVFKENFDRRILAGMLLIVAGGVLLAWGGHARLNGPWGPLAIVGACLAWAIDNNLTRKISASDAVQIAGIKGIVAGGVNTLIAVAAGAEWPAWNSALAGALVGFAGYGLSLVMFVVALRHLGAARTGAYFSTAPFVGAAISLPFLHETPTLWFWLAATVMAIGVWLHLTERHEHVHTHEALRHAHPHVHDEHHRHAHGFRWDGTEPHTHEHDHEPSTHSHAHFPDVHHRHGH